ncbi:MAG: cysteine desulfurase [Candidatus Marinimicrobia bacterium]|jgi:cysteine desulfurase|nr:cysteine desulfurase [Candidatus Neomarinimicrobiota bacterium]MBT3828714.1 cysteine desulfurase [Candidatus Neomarinimicrobiota bacterium]MBT3996664.1 cysteine desulfurase [Candidatus Neomarinimicrobiota bacterium]MBT4569966.1 cysteine desulfurase [Candidatus Neomarinimicrobiota bacterium]MBT6000253.1 cysteine desulfurase [Candidatus Neomarinimicrobiota bacterium]
MNNLYLDNHATTPVDAEVLKAMIPYFTEKFGNAASRHPFGWKAQEAVDRARTIISDELNAKPKEIIFTSGATESVNLAIKGFCEANKSSGKHIITQVTEHKAVLDNCAEMEKRGWDVTTLPVQADGLISLEDLKGAIQDNTVLVSIMHANNEIGVIHDLEAIGALCKKNGICFFTDAAQSFGKIPTDVQAMNLSMLAGTAHKMYGPKGIGFLYVNSDVKLKLQMDGGGHERGLRSGTLPVPLIVGFGKAVNRCADLRDEETKRMKPMRDRLLNGILHAFPDTIVNGTMARRLTNNLNVSFPNVDGEALHLKLESISCSSGSACTSATLEPSYVMKALGHSDTLAKASIRIGFGRLNTESDVDEALKEIVGAVQSFS